MIRNFQSGLYCTMYIDHLQVYNQMNIEILDLDLDLYLSEKKQKCFSKVTLNCQWPETVESTVSRKITHIYFAHSLRSHIIYFVSLTLRYGHKSSTGAVWCLFYTMLIKAPVQCPSGGRNIRTINKSLYSASYGARKRNDLKLTGVCTMFCRNIEDKVTSVGHCSETLCNLCSIVREPVCDRPVKKHTNRAGRLTAPSWASTDVSNTDAGRRSLDTL